MKVYCSKCGNEWEYKGKSTYYACCPNCKKSIKIFEVNSPSKYPISKRGAGKPASPKE